MLLSHTSQWYLRTRNTVRGADLECRVCGKALDLERFSLSKCCVIRQVFARLRSCVSQYVPQVKMDDAFIYLGVIDSGKVLSESLSALHILTWRFVIIEFVQVETKGTKFDPERVWAQVLRRFEVRVRAYGEGMRRTAEKRVAQGGEGLNERELTQHAERLNPCATPTEGGSWHWEARMAMIMSAV